jgi:ATP phosphoribosyltransferase regulatory subunit
MLSPVNVRLSGEEIAGLQLRALYSGAGYTQYRMSKFEEYDLYARNKDFLLASQIITFSDGGRLMALKPDVTLSIVKNTEDSPQQTQKLFYDEQVYRASDPAEGFREIRQIGLECLGAIDNDCVAEVVVLAARSLIEAGAGQRAMLSISPISVLSGLLEKAGLSADDRDLLTGLISDKKIHEIRSLCADFGIDAASAEALCTFAWGFGSAGEMLGLLESLPEGFIGAGELQQLKTICAALGPDLSKIVRVDFSSGGNSRYYSGISFKGYIDGVPQAVLSGGQYDGLMRSMGRSGGAIGFAVYMDLLGLRLRGREVRIC